ncbi:MAG: thiamine pyrophosphate-dependent enzyme, partial [Dehalococcoidia bacterium]|nr:thiamine pyrophosphate-dependent enzyme [Dehalococcoidia bacterium]
NAWCDQAPVLLLGGGAAFEAAKRRNMPEWLHAAIVPGELVRNYVKWDHHVLSVSGLLDTFIRGYKLAVDQPQGPVFICLDAIMQESEVAEPVAMPPSKDILNTSTLYPDPEVVKQIASLLVNAEMPVIFADRAGALEKTSREIQELAEVLAAPVLTMGHRFNIPCDHHLDLTGAASEILPGADVLLSLEAEDLWGYVHKMGADRSTVTSLVKSGCKVIDVSLRDLGIKGWIQNYQRLPNADVSLTADISTVVPALLRACKKIIGKEQSGARHERKQWVGKKHKEMRVKWKKEAASLGEVKPIALPWLIREIWPAIENEDWTLTTGHSALAEWARRLWTIDSPRRYVPSGGIGLGREIGVAIGSALACRGENRLVIDLQPEGDLLFTPQAIWTAARCKLPVVVIVYNNLCYGNSELHFGMVAGSRGRSEETRGVGTFLEDPRVNFAEMARSFGAYAEGPVSDPQDIGPAVKRAVRESLKNSMPAVVDVICRRNDHRTGYM